MRSTFSRSSSSIPWGTRFLSAFLTAKITRGFSRAIGEASCFVAEQGGCVFGTLGAMVRSLLLPDGQEKEVAYFADLKVTPGTYRGAYLVQIDAVCPAMDGWPRVCGVWNCHGWNPGDSRALHGSPGIPAV